MNGDAHASQAASQGRVSTSAEELDRDVCGAEEKERCGHGICIAPEELRKEHRKENQGLWVRGRDKEFLPSQSPGPRLILTAGAGVALL
ncbi:hypothetical protein [Streptomyces alboflavus]|uniref:hypothetical protein n=1 Tax=Streptomyces alboflavus TaxID=67267 RepID=UPI00368198F2